MNEIAEALNWLQDSISGILQWLQKYKAGYLVIVLIAARITWRIYQSRRAKVKRALVPTQPGQAAFGAIQEVVRLLEADPETDWSKVNLTALHEHLVDMDEVTLRVTNLAARLGDRATGGQILASAETVRRLRGRFRLRSLGALSLKNISNPVEALEVAATPVGA